MNARFVLPAIALTAAALATGPASAEPVQVDQCLRDVGCAGVLVDPAGQVALQSGSLCTPGSVASFCANPTTTAEKTTSGQGGYEMTILCATGARGLVHATVDAKPNGSFAVVAVRGVCSLHDSHGRTGSAVAEGSGPVATGTGMAVPPRSSTHWCVEVSARWSDGATWHDEQYATANCAGRLD